MTTSFREIAARMDRGAGRAATRLRGSVDPDAVGLFDDDDEAGLLALHRDVTEDSLREVLDRHADPDATSHRLLFYNTFLLKQNSEAKLLGARAHEIGRMIREDYDVAALCEVFRPAELDDVRAETPGFDDANGPGAAIGASAGLNTFVREDAGEREIAYQPLPDIWSNPTGESILQYLRRQRHVTFEDNGSVFTGDADALSNKGVLRTPIDVGVGTVDLYSTHLFSGGGVWGFEDLFGLDRAEVNELRLDQVDELLDFVERTGRDDRVTVVVGDFNVDASRQWYDDLTAKMAAHGLHDAWPVRGGPKGRTVYARSGSPRAGVCWFQPGSDGPDYHCDDHHDYDDGDTTERDEYNRIDYVFVEEPRDAHAFTLDLTRVRRRSGWWGEAQDPDRGDPDDYWYRVYYVDLLLASILDIADRGPYDADELRDLLEAQIDTIRDFAGLLGIDDVSRDDVLDVLRGAGVVTSTRYPQYLSDHLGLDVELIASPN